MESTRDEKDLELYGRVNEAAIRLALLALLVVACAMIVLPFAAPVIWGAVLAVAVAPLHRRVVGWFGGRGKLAAVLMALLALALLLVPTLLLIGSVFDTSADLARRLDAGTLTVPPPSEEVAEWPVVGERISKVWAQAADDSASFAEDYAPQLKSLGEKLLSAIAGLGGDVLFLTIAIVIAAVFLVSGERSEQLAEKVCDRVTGNKGAELVTLTVKTVRSVAQGVVGIAAIQALAAGLGMLLAGVPGAGLWTLLVLIVAVIQLPTVIVLVPVAIYVFSAESTTTAVLFLIWALLVGLSDNFLKPLLLGRGVEVPMLVILIGAIGGMISMGIIGLFLGAVILAVGHQLFVAWLADDLSGASKESSTARS